MQRRIDIHSFKPDINLIPTSREFTADPSLAGFIKGEWEKTGWKDSWCLHFSGYKHLWTGPDPQPVEYTGINADAIRYSQIHGLVQAIQLGHPCAPILTNHIGMGIIPITSDGYLVIRKRPADLAHASGLWEIPGGQMTSMLFAEGDPSDERYASDPKLFGFWEQAQRLAAKIGKQLGGINLTLRSFPIPSGSFGYVHSLGLKIGYAADVDAASEEVLEKNPERVRCISPGELEMLIANPKEVLSGEFEDVCLGQLIGGGYREITGKELDPRVIEELSRNRWEINFLDCQSHSVFSSSNFQTSPNA